MRWLAFALTLALACSGDDDAASDAGPAGRPDGAAPVDGGGEDAAAGGDDAGPGTDAGGGVDAGAPAGSVPMFVAVGWGGRRITSCDGGRTWIADQQEAPEGEDDWHRPYTPKALAWGGGAFVFLTGWGNPSTAWVSTDGVSWTAHALETTYGGVGWDDGRFVLVGNRNVAVTDDLFETVEVLEIEAPSYDRDAAAFEGIWVSGADGEVETRVAGGSWARLASCSGQRHTAIGVRGGFAAGLGRMVSFGDGGATCVVDAATGADLGAGDLGVGSVDGYGAFVGDAFWMVTGGAIHASTDGLSWSSRALPGGVDFDRVARAEDGTYVGVGGGDRFYWSDDGETWTRADAPAGNGILRVVAGWGAPSAQCPAP